MGQTSTLFRARRLALRNARAAGGGAFRPWVVLAILGTCAALVGLGQLSVDSLLSIPGETATPTFGKRAPVVGDSALEAAFWLSTLLSAFFAFRVMESLFRSGKVRALELLPVRPAPILAERCANAGVEAVALALVPGFFFMPMLWNGQPRLAGLCVLLALGATLSTAAVTIGTNAWFGAQYGGVSGLGDGYGGQGGAFIYAPMVSFATSVVCILMLQLGAREVLHSGRVGNAFMLATGISFGIAAGTLIVGARHFVRSYHRVAAFFREADEVGFRAVLDYQESIWVPVTMERLAGPGAVIFRRHVTQFGRRFPVARSLVVIGSAGGVLGAAFLSSAALPAWIVAVIPMLLFAVLERPFGRIDDALLGGSGDALLPLGDAILERARFAWSLYETGRVAVPYGIAAGLAVGWHSSVTDGVLVALVGTAAPIALSVSAAAARALGVRGQGAANLVAVAVTVALAGLSAVHLVAGAIVAGLTAASAVLFLRSESRT